MTTKLPADHLSTSYFDCDCASPEHTLRFTLDREENALHTEIYLYQYRPVYKRVWIAIKYVFGYPCRYGHWDCWILRNRDARRLRSLLNEVIDDDSEE